MRHPRLFGSGSRARLLIVTTLILLSVFLVGHAAACRSVVDVDIRNAAIDHQSGTWQFQRGIAESSDEGNSTQPDWKATIQSDAVVVPEPSIQIRFVEVENVHLTGSGSWRSLLALRCLNGELATVQEWRYMTLKVEKLESKKIRLSWVPDSSGSRRSVELKWDHERQQYVRK